MRRGELVGNATNDSMEFSWMIVARTNNREGRKFIIDAFFDPIKGLTRIPASSREERSRAIAMP